MKEAKKPSVFGIIKQIFTLLVVIIAVSMMIFTIIAVTTFNHNDRNIFGYKLFIDLTDSMASEGPGGFEGFKAGDLVIVKEVKTASEIAVNDVITYQSLIPGETYGQPITHMVRETTTDANGNLAFITYGVVTGSDDPLAVSFDYVLGKYVVSIPSLGKFFNYTKTTVGYIFCIFVPFMLLIGMQGINCIRIFKKYKAEQMECIAKDKAKLEEERAETQRMMAELMELKAKLAEKENTERKD